MEKNNKTLNKQFKKMCNTAKLYRSKISGQDVWDLYISSFEEDPKFRDPESSVHNCNLCKTFVRRYGNIVAIDDNNNIITMFDDITDIEEEMIPVFTALSEYIKTFEIRDVFVETFDSLNSLPYEKCTKTQEEYQLGTKYNVKLYNKEEAEKFGVVKEGETRKFHHLHVILPKQFVDMSGKSIESIQGEYRDAKNVFQRAMEEIPVDTLVLVKDLINQGSLLDGTTHLYKIDQILPLKRQYDALSSKERDNWCWQASFKLPFAKFRNELIGTLCKELAEGEELNKACQSWNKRVDPSNYMKATAPITKKQIEEAQKFVEENGFTASFNRRLATVDDIKVTEILHSNSGDRKVKGVSLFDGVKAAPTRHKRNEFDGVEEINIDKFMKDILPGCTSIEAYLENRHEGNMVTMTTTNEESSLPIFKWNNNYSWTFKGNLAGKSQIKEAVKAAGGVIDAIMRGSMTWNDGSPADDGSDLDVWCTQPDGEKIGFSTFRGNYRFSSCGGNLDVDNRHPGGKLAVENIYFKNKNSLKDGTYTFYVNQWSAHNSKGFKFEIEIDGEIYGYEYDRALKSKQNVVVAIVTYKKGVFSIEHKLPESQLASKEIWNLETAKFHKVNLVCLSPNHWGENNIGNKHYMFMLDGCKTNENIRGFHNENLIPQLAEHRKVLEVLGNTCMIEPTDDQLSGIAFNSTVRDSLIVKLQGSHKRTVKINF